jgi:hypothetical protein
MCYASPVMLRVSCSCAISVHDILASFVFSSLFRMLSPTIPVHPRNAPVSPIIPVHTQKQGGGVHFPLPPLPPLLPLPLSHSPLSLTIPACPERFSRRALTRNRGWVGYLNGNVPKICRRADIFRSGKECGNAYGFCRCGASAPPSWHD